MAFVTSCGYDHKIQAGLVKTNMLTFDAIFQKHHSDLDTFNALIPKNKTMPCHFLMIVRPLMQYVYEYLHSREHVAQIAEWLPNNFLRRLVVEKFIYLVNPVIIRTCVLELHLATRSNLLAGASPKKRFDFFLRVLSEPNNTKDFFDKYVELKQLVMTCALQSMNVLDELLGRLAKDKKQLITHFLNGETGYRLKFVSSTGDVHRQGRAVSILVFEKNKKIIRIVYKPHPIKIDIAFQKFVHWFNTIDPKYPLKTIYILDKKTYGWTEFVDYQACKTENEVIAFYIRLGKLLMLIYLFRGFDMHGENVIASGAHPVVVDFECLMNPSYSFADKPDQRTLRFFVMQTSFLPAMFRLKKDHEGVDVSALGSEAGAESTMPSIKWRDIGLDSMHSERVHLKMQGYLNKPKLGSKLIDYLLYEEVFLKGFKTAYRHILQHRTSLLGIESPLRHFKQASIRLVLLSTAIYVHYIHESWHPKYLVNHKSRLDYFKSHWNKSKKIVRRKPVLEAEIQDMLENNVPFFSSTSTSKQFLNSREQPLPSPVLKNGLSLVKEHIKHTLSDRDLFLQETLIKNSFSVARENQKKNPPLPMPMQGLVTKSLNELRLKDKARRLAEKALDKLGKYHFFMQEDIFWPSSEMSEDSSWVMNLSNNKLYNGLPGIALCYLYASDLFPNKPYKEMARHCINTIKNAYKSVKDTPYQPLGAYSGNLYTLAAFYRRTGDNSLKTMILKTLAVMPKQIKSDEKLDVIGGAAGSLLILLSMQDILPQKTLLPLLRACAQRLLKQCPVPSEFSMLGMAHGLAGMAYALHRYSLVAPDKHITAWISAALAYERSHFNPRQGNWPNFLLVNLKKASKPSYDLSWCHGAPGIGLARLGMAKQWQDDVIQKEINRAINTTLKQGVGVFSCLCHGSFGNLDFLALACETYQDAKLKTAYLNAASTLLDSLEQGGCQCSQLINAATPGLMTGQAGIAYALMRIAEPQAVPSILLL